MTNALDQQRIILKNLKVADFASRESLCFTATVVFDGEPIADADNDGHGAATIVRARQGKRDRLAAAEEFVENLPPEVTEYDDPTDSSRRFTIEITLDYLVESLACTMHAQKKMRAAFNRDMANKVMYVKAGQLMYLKGVNLKAIPDRQAYFAALRARQKEPVTILAELPPDEAFALWRQFAIDDDA